jgi:endonuclease/exonuclease/phosphatase family metal-dependent hydrolase
MRLATFNAENLFRRPRVMNLDNWAEGKPVLNDVAELNDLIAQSNYDSVKDRIEELLNNYEFGNPNKQDRPFVVNETRGKLFKNRKGTKKVYVSAQGRSDWVGWIDLVSEDLSAEAISNTGRVVTEVNADIQLMVEVEDRLTLKRFNEQILSSTDAPPAYRYCMLIDGNDGRGIDIGLLSRETYRLVSVRSHIDEPYPDRSKVLFSRDCAEFEIDGLPGGKTLWVLGNHFKSKGYGDKGASDAKRKAQADRVADIYQDVLTRSDYVAVMGDFNDTPDSDALGKLLSSSGLKDVMAHPRYEGDPGTYQTGKSPNQKIDYLLLSPALWAHVAKVGVERRGVYAPRTFPHFPGLTARTAASDHAAVWVDLDF